MRSTPLSSIIGQISTSRPSSQPQTTRSRYPRRSPTSVHAFQHQSKLENRLGCSRLSHSAFHGCLRDWKPLDSVTVEKAGTDGFIDVELPERLSSKSGKQFLSQRIIARMRTRGLSA